MRGRWLLVGAVIAALIVGLIFFLLARSSGSFVVRTIDYVVSNLANRSGVSPFLIRGLVILLTIPFFWAVAKYIKSIWGFQNLKPSLKLYTNRYGIIIVAYVGVFFISMYFASLDALAYKWCADTPEGIRTFDAPGIDPVYGVELKPCMFEQIAALRQQKVGFHGAKQIEINDPERYEFFDPITGRPKVWFYRTSQGVYELYDKPGMHPRTGHNLIPVDSVAVQDIIRLYRERTVEQAQATAEYVENERRSKEEAFLGRYLNPGIVNRKDMREVAIVFLTEGAEISSIKDSVAQAIAKQGVQPIHSLFKPGFVREGRAKTLWTGDWASVKDLKLSERVDYLIMVQGDDRYTKNPQFEGLLTAQLRVELKCLDIVSRRVCGNRTINTQGAGYGKSEALQNALSNSISQMEAFAGEIF